MGYLDFYPSVKELLPRPTTACDMRTQIRGLNTAWFIRLVTITSLSLFLAQWGNSRAFSGCVYAGR